MTSRKKTVEIVVFTLLIMLSSSSQADEVLLTNGDRLTGQVDKITEGKLYFLSDLAGSVTIDMINVKTFTTERTVKIVLTDGTETSRQILGSTVGNVELAAEELTKAQSIKLTDIAAVNPPKKEPPKWHGNVSVGWTSAHGNTNSETIQASANASLRREEDRIVLAADYGKAEQEDPDTGEEETTEDWWKTKGKYDYFFSKKLYGFLEGRYETDKVAELESRFIKGIGAGYQWVESDVMNFSTEAGLAHLSERFDNKTGNNNELSAQIGYHFDRKFTGQIKFINDLTYYPSIGEFSDYYLTTTSELRAQFTEKMFANLKAIFDYDTSPAEGKGNTDVKYIAGVGWNF